MWNSFEEFKTAVNISLRDKISERLDQEREHISNSLFAEKPQNSGVEVSDSNEKEI